MTRYAVLPLLTVLIAGVGLAQIARQGEDQTEFHSPMILELAFPPADVDPSVKETGWLTGKEPLSKYRCDNVAITNLRSKLTEIEGKKAKIDVELFLHNRIGHDKAVTITFELLNGDQVVGTSVLSVKEVKETDTAQRALILTLPREKLVKGVTKLKLTMKVVDV